jgi:hypothetical protein
MTITIGSASKLNNITGVFKLIKISAAEKSSLANKVLSQNMIVIDSDGSVYITDGTTTIGNLSDIPATNKLMNQSAGDSRYANKSTFETVTTPLTTAEIEAIADEILVSEDSSGSGEEGSSSTETEVSWANASYTPWTRSA